MRSGRDFSSTASAVMSAAGVLAVASGDQRAATVGGNGVEPSREQTDSAQVPRAARFKQWSAPMAEHRHVLEQAVCDHTSGVRACETTFTIQSNAR